MPRLTLLAVLLVSMPWLMAEEPKECVPPEHRFSTTELARLIDELKPPARFADYVPAFSVQKKTVTFEHRNGPEQMEMYFILDQGKVVAVMPTGGFHGGWIYLQSWDPAQLKTELELPKERWHCDTMLGSSIRTEQFMPSKKWDNGETNTWQPLDDGKRLMLTRHFKGEANISEWELKYKGQLDATNTFVLQVDPVLGYVIDATWQVGANPAVKSGQYCSLYPPLLSNPWAGADRISQIVCTPDGEAGMQMHAKNHAAVGQSSGGSWNCRDLGFAAYLDHTTGWSPAMPVIGGNARLSVCNVHADQDFIVQWPQEPNVDAAGYTRHTYQTRLCWVPPEVTKQIFEKAQMRYEGQSRVIIAIGSPEGFEDSPTPLTQAKPGLTFTSGGPAIVDTHAHSGKKSMQLRGRVWPNLPQLPLKPDRKYRISAWIKVLVPSPEEKAAYKASWEKRAAGARGAYDKQVAKLKKDGKESEIKPFVAPVWEEPAPSEAYITADTYEWTPHNGERITRISTTRAKEGQDWQQVSVEFTADKWGPFSDLAFVCTNGATAYVDDFYFEEVK